MSSEKTLADEMAEHDARLAEAIAEQGVAEPPAADENAETTIDSIEQFFIDEGQWLDGQISSNAGVHKNCPVCVMTEIALQSLSGALKDALENLDKLQKDLQCDLPFQSDSIILDTLKRDRAWYLLTKEISIALCTQGHAPRNVINAHPEFRSMAATKRIQTRHNSQNRNKKPRLNRKKGR